MTKSRAPLVYLSGAIDNAPPGGQSWRSLVKETLEEADIDWIDPSLRPSLGHTPLQVYEDNAAAFTRADLILAEFALPVPHYGTVVEIERGVALGKRVVVWIGDMTVPLYLRRHFNRWVVPGKEVRLLRPDQERQVVVETTLEAALGYVVGRLGAKPERGA